MRAAALALLLTAACVAPGGRPRFIGNAELVHVAAEAARRCGIRNAWIKPYEGETALFIYPKSARSKSDACLWKWAREEAPPDLGVVVVTE